MQRFRVLGCGIWLKLSRVRSALSREAVLCILVGNLLGLAGAEALAQARRGETRDLGDGLKA